MYTKIKNKLLMIYRKRGVFYFFTRTIFVDHDYPILSLFNYLSRVYSYFFNKTLIFVIGDSHTKPFEYIKGFLVYEIGQSTAHNLIKDKSSSNSKQIFFKILSKVDIKKDKVMLVFGEIDARLHFYDKHMRSGKKVSLETLMDRTLENFGKFMNELNRKNVSFIVLGIPPVGNQPNIYNYKYYGDREQRRDISLLFNKKLKIFCEKNNYLFIDIQKRFSDISGFLKREYGRDGIHMNNKIVPYVTSFIYDTL